MKKKIRAVQYGVGPIGAAIVRLMREKDAIEIIGAIDSDPAKAGRDLGDVVGGSEAPWGVPISDNAEAMLAKSPDVVIHSTSSYLPDVMDQLLACLAAECSVVSTCEELSYPFRKHPELSAKLDAEARSSGVALIGTGINPGFVMDKLLITLSAAAQTIESARAVRIVDASKRRLPLQKKVGAGMTEMEFRAQVTAGVIKHHGLPESVAMVSDALGLDVDEISETIEPVIARETVKTPFLEVARRPGGGRASGRQGICRKQGKNLHGIANVRRRHKSRRYRGNRGQSEPDDDHSRRHAWRHRHRLGRRQLHSRNSRRYRGSANFARPADVVSLAQRKTLIIEGFPPLLRRYRESLGECSSWSRIAPAD